MTSKLSFITFVPLTLAALAVKVIQLFYLGADGTFYGFNELMLSYVVIGCALLAMLFASFFCLIDRKTAPVYLINKNAACGIFGLLFAVALACDCANNAFLSLRNMTADFFTIADIVLTLLSAIVFVVLGLNHFVGNGGVRGLSVFYLVPALWAAFRLVKCFLGFTTVSILVTDVSELATYIFVTLFLFNFAMIVALMKGKSPVRAAYVYGMPSVVMLLSVGVFGLLQGYFVFSSTFNIFAQIGSIEFLALGLYIFSFLVELSVCVKRKDQIELIEESDEDEEYDDVDDPDSDIVDAVSNSVLYGNDPEQAVTDVAKVGYNEEDHLAIDDDVFIEVAQASLNSDSQDYLDDVDTSDFIYGAAPSDDDFVLPVDAPEEGAYEVVPDESVEHYITKEDSAYEEEDDAPDDEDVDAKLDRIDRLILELSGDESAE